jgi:hypothetical protein
VPGVYAVDNGTAVGGSAFLLTVAADGTLSTSNPDAEVGGSTVVFRNVTITIQPGAYGGQHRISSYRTLPSSGVVSRVLIPALRYCLDNGAFVGASSFRFLIDASGSITSQNAAAAEGVGSVLQLKNASITIDPVQYPGPYVGSFIAGSIASGLQAITVIPALTTSRSS